MIRKKESLINEMKSKCTVKRINKAKFGWTKEILVIPTESDYV